MVVASVDAAAGVRRMSPSVVNDLTAGQLRETLRIQPDQEQLAGRVEGQCTVAVPDPDERGLRVGIASRQTMSVGPELVARLHLEARESKILVEQIAEAISTERLRHQSAQCALVFPGKTRFPTARVQTDGLGTCPVAAHKDKARMVNGRSDRDAISHFVGKFPKRLPAGRVETANM